MSRDHFGPSPGPYRIEWESCDCGDYCGHGSYPYRIVAPARRVFDPRRKGDEGRSAVIADLVEAEDATEADARLLAASWSLLRYAESRAAAGDAEAARLVRAARGEACPECGEFSASGALCGDCEARWASAWEDDGGASGPGEAT